MRSGRRSAFSRDPHGYLGANPHMTSKMGARARSIVLTLGSLVLVASAGAQAQQRAAAVEITHAQVRQLSPSVKATGVVQSRAAAGLAAPVEGRIEWVAEPGTTVRANEIVARLDVSQLRLGRAEQAASVTRADVNLKSLDREL